MFKKKAQSWSLESYVAIGIFLFAIIFFYALITLKAPSETLKDEAKSAANNLLAEEIFKDNVISYSEAQQIANWSCSDLKSMLKTDKDVCIYFTDNEGNLIPIKTDPVVYSIGCSGVNVSGRPCGS